MFRKIRFGGGPIAARIFATLTLLAFLIAINPLGTSAAQQGYGPDRRILGRWCNGQNEALFTVTPVNDATVTLATYIPFGTATYTMHLLPSTLGVDSNGNMQYIPSTDIVRVTRGNKIQFGYFFHYGDGQHYDPDLPVHSAVYVDYSAGTSHTYQIQRCK